MFQLASVSAIARSFKSLDYYFHAIRCRDGNWTHGINETGRKFFITLIDTTTTLYSRSIYYCRSITESAKTARVPSISILILPTHL